MKKQFEKRLAVLDVMDDKTFKMLKQLMNDDISIERRWQISGLLQGIENPLYRMCLAEALNDKALQILEEYQDVE